MIRMGFCLFDKKTYLCDNLFQSHKTIRLVHVKDHLKTNHLTHATYTRTVSQDGAERQRHTRRHEAQRLHQLF